MPSPLTAAEYRASLRRGSDSARRRWSNAIRTACGCGRTHPSKLQARVCARLRLECKATGARLYHDVRLPLLSIAPKRSGSPETICVDFVVVDPDGIWHLIDAKAPGRVSRDWRLRTAAVWTTFGREVKEVDR